jgi:hypothetical protein
LRKFLLLPAVVALTVTALAAAGATSGAARPAPASALTAQLAAMQHRCAVVAVHLNGAQHTMTCAASRRSAGMGRLSPAIWRNNSCILADMVIWNYNYSGEVCFDGDGYLGVGIYDVNEVDNASVVQEWIRYYNSSGGHFCTMQVAWDIGIPGASTQKKFGNNSTVKITQVDINGSNGPTC